MSNNDYHKIFIKFVIAGDKNYDVSFISESKERIKFTMQKLSRKLMKIEFFRIH